MGSRGNRRRREGDKAPHQPDNSGVHLRIPAEQIYHRGKKRTVAYASTLSGRCQAKIYLDGIVGDSKMMNDKANLEEHLRTLADVGWIANRERFENKADGFFALKSAKLRLVLYQDGAAWFITHGFTKDEKKWRPEEFEKARKIRSAQRQLLEKLK